MKWTQAEKWDLEEGGLLGPALVAVGFGPDSVESDKLVLMGEGKSVDRRQHRFSWNEKGEMVPAFS